MNTIQQSIDYFRERKDYREIKETGNFFEGRN